ncbi:MAG: hypothetical protein KF773_29310 [Deltaproteobacteria bacterium]|nr:hypothetical protein [Deltaproteobacteria bacterium]
MTTCDERTLRTAREQYWAENDFGADGGDSLKWVTVKAFGIPFKIPNTEGRRRAVRVHDLHHVVTGYKTDLRGEAEIGAWELATGCFRRPAAFVLNLLVISFGFFLAPRRLVRAWARGRRSRNLYGVPYDDALLAQTVEATRRGLGLHPAPPPARATDAVGFGLAWLGSLPLLALPTAPLLALFVAVWWLL